MFDSSLSGGIFLVHLGLLCGPVIIERPFPRCVKKKGIPDLRRRIFRFPFNRIALNISGRTNSRVPRNPRYRARGLGGPCYSSKVYKTRRSTQVLGRSRRNSRPTEAHTMTDFATASLIGHARG